MKRHKRFVIICCILFLFAGLIFISPRYLLYSTDYKKTDAIIILLGPDFKARKKEADALLNKGMANYLIIPAYHKAYTINARTMEKKLTPYKNSPASANYKDVSYPGFYEDTHLEILEARQVMSIFGLKSAIFVSSPYHMRRVQLIVRSVFDSNNGAFYFVPTSFEKAPANFWELSSVEWRKVRREYSKILWFYVYSTWTGLTG